MMKQAPTPAPIPVKTVILKGLDTALSPGQKQTELRVEDKINAQQAAIAFAYVGSSLFEAAKKALFSIGFGTMGLGAVTLLGELLGKPGSLGVRLLATGAFFTFASIGRLLDRKLKLERAPR